jgi:lipopolysaccharide/colanic/teichoic acid biosynthesis glycosyltransferase
VTVARVSATEPSALDEEVFRHMIALERKRSERSKRAFLLMLLNAGENLAEDKNGEVLGKTLSALATSTRETDVTGWYKRNLVVGVIFTELSLGNRQSLLSTIKAKVDTALRDNLTLEQFNQINISFHPFPDEWNEEAQKGPTDPAVYPDVSGRANGRRLSTFLKRTIDIFGSALALLLCTPLFLAVAIAIKTTSRGPVLFRQRRIGQHGQSFVFLKFRTMYENNDAAVHEKYIKQWIAGKAQRNPSKRKGEGVYKLTSDSRITRVGAFLRRTSLDEVPQFLNVLKGEMSLVGPRPAIPYEVESYELWHRRRFLEAKPGITGLWQVSGRNRIKFADMVRLDLLYARTWSPWLDIRILFRTPLAVLQGAH